MPLKKLAKFDGQLAVLDGDGHFADHRDESHGFAHGELLSVLGAGGYQLATNDDPAKWCAGIAYITGLATATEYAVLTSANIFPWPSHGLGGRGAILWLGVNGAITTTKPRNAFVLQRVGWILDNDTIMWSFEWPTIF